MLSGCCCVLPVPVRSTSLIAGIHGVAAICCGVSSSRRDSSVNATIIPTIAIHESLNDGNGILIGLILQKDVDAEEVIHPMITDGTESILNVGMDGRIINA